MPSEMEATSNPQPDALEKVAHTLSKLKMAPRTLSSGGEMMVDGIRFEDYKDESQLDFVMSLVGRDLSEPYSTVPEDGDLSQPEPIGCVVAKIDQEELTVGGKTQILSHGYIGMLAVSKDYRRRGIGKALVHNVILRMKQAGCLSVTLETEVTNLTAQRLYQDTFGFLREELLVRYYLNWNDAYRLRLWFDGN